MQESTALNRSLEAEVKALNASREGDALLIREIAAQYPEALRVAVGSGSKAQRSSASPEDAVIVTLTVDQPISAQAQTRLKAWLKARYTEQAVELVVTEELPPVPPKKRSSRSKR